MDDLPVFNCDNRDEPVVIVRTARENLAMHFIFEDHDATFRGAMNDQCIARMKLDRVPSGNYMVDGVGQPGIGYLASLAR
jgi:hypothetical protein